MRYARTMDALVLLLDLTGETLLRMDWATAISNSRFCADGVADIVQRPEAHGLIVRDTQGDP